MSDVLVQKEEGLIEMILKPNAELLMQPIKADRRSIARAICEGMPNQFQEVMDFLKTIRFRATSKV